MRSDAQGAVAMPVSGEVAGSDTGDPALARNTAVTTVTGVGASTHLRTGLFVLDFVTVATCWVGLSLELRGAPTLFGRLAPAVAAAASMLVAMRALGLYQSRRCVRKSDEFWRVVTASLWGSAAYALIESQVAAVRSLVLICAGASVVTVTACRWEFGRVLRAQRARGRYQRGVILVGADENAMELRAMLRSEPELGYSVVGVVGDGDGHAWSDLPWAPSVADIPTVARATGANGILLVPYGLSRSVAERAIATASDSGLHVQVWPGFRRVGSRRLRSVPISGEPFFYVEPRASSHVQLAAKRAIDVVGASVALLLATPVLAVAALLIKLEDRGPVFFGGERVGMGGTTFVAYKLRSMTVGGSVTASTLASLNERTDGPLFKASNDPRVTRVGRVLRASSIDELPQLWNVLRGTMSLVGPRPALPGEVDKFDEEHRRRHAVRPGLTGLWQVEARRNPSFNAYRRLDLQYVDNWSLSLDLAILVATVPSVLSHALRDVRGTWHKRRSHPATSEAAARGAQR